MLLQSFIVVRPLILLGLIWPAWALDRKPEDASLAGLPGVHVVVEKLSAEIDPTGILDVELEADVEILLDKGGIKVLQFNEVSSTPGRPFFHIQVRDMKDPNLPVFAVSITGSLNQRVILERNSEMRATAQTWVVAGVTSAGPTSLKEQIKAGTEKITREFINAYRAVNRK